jgi:pyruvate dehydrogenase E1 component
MPGASETSAGGVERDAIETQEWLESLDYVVEHGGARRVEQIFRALRQRAAELGLPLRFTANTPYINTIPREHQPPFPGARDIERRITSLVRWNAMAMVVRANREEHGIGGHLSTFASAAKLYEVAFNHFLHGREHPEGGDQLYIQGHAAPGIYARAFLEGRLSSEQLENFRRELRPGGGLSSYPHPRLMPDFWEFPTVSMGLSPLMAIYQARFNRYLQDRQLVAHTGRVWAFLGDGELDEPESLGAIGLAAREHLDNLTFVVNCNLQRLDGPVRGNGKIIQELEAIFRGAGWNVIKVIWGDSWDALLARDHDGVLVARMEQALDGDYQMYSVAPGAYTRKHFFGTDPRLAALVADLSDDEIHLLRRGGHDPEKVYAAYQAAVAHRGSPTVILAKTIKGYGLGEAGEGRNVSHQQKQLNEDELRQFRTRFAIPISDHDIAAVPFYRPADDSVEMRYLRARRQELGGYLPARRGSTPGLDTIPDEPFMEFQAGSKERQVSTTMVFVRLLAKLLRDKSLGRLVVPIIPDEARTFGMEALFRQVGIYSHIGQQYEPVDKETLLYYREATDGQILEEGITEAGAMSSFIAAGTAYATHGVNTIPFFLFYSMFGFQRIGDLIWAAGDMRCRGFLLGGTAGRTTLAGEGLQHQDGHSHLLACSNPAVTAYDPAFAYEIAVIVRDGIRRMYVDRQDCMYYLTLGNEPYAMPPMPETAAEGIVRGMYCFRRAEHSAARGRAVVLGSGALMNAALGAQALLASRWGIAADVWSVTSYQQLYRDAVDSDRWNRLHPAEPARLPYVTRCLRDGPPVVVAVSDYTQMLAYSIARWIPGRCVALGTDGFGRSDSRAALRSFFEVDARYIAAAVLDAMARQGEIAASEAAQAISDLHIDPDKPNPAGGTSDASTDQPSRAG